jgi:hypothetical protein
MDMTGAGPPGWSDQATLQEVRPVVRELLLSSEAFRKLPPDEQRELAGQMVKVSSYLANPEGLGLPSETTPLAVTQADATEAARARAATDPGFAGQDFEAGALEAGTRAFGALVGKVNFPNFVSGLIQGVFQAIVDSSLQQMRAYGELLANVAKTVDQFMQDHITENNARDWLVQTFPDALGLESSSAAVGFAEGSPTGAATPVKTVRLTAKGDDPEAALKAVSEAVRLPEPVTDVSDEAQELRLVLQARREMARGRQQLLASMVMLGINRIVVTDGMVNAKVLFDVNAQDQAKRRSRASLLDSTRSRNETEMEAGYGSWFSPWSASVKHRSSTDHVATVESAVDDTSESRAELKAKLSGEVRVNFKSDFMPMERLATPQMVAAIQGNATPLEQPVSGAR